MNNANGDEIDEGSGTRADWAFTALEAVILGGKLNPGDRLNEPALARQLGISRGPLREAIQRLEGRKLVKRIPRFGATVVALSKQDLQEIFQLREVMEGLACRLATEAMADSELDLLERILSQAELELSAAGNGEFQFKGAGDPDFHVLIINGSRNSRLIDALLSEIYPLMQVYRFRSRRSPGRVKQAFAEHRAILAAMRARETERAESLMRIHIRSARITVNNEEFQATGETGREKNIHEVQDEQIVGGNDGSGSD